MRSLAAPMSPPGLTEEEEGCEREPQAEHPPTSTPRTVEASYSQDESRRARLCMEDPVLAPGHGPALREAA